MPAIRYSEDTEFNDALRARGIIPPLPTVDPEQPIAEEPAKPGPGPRELLDRLDDKNSIQDIEFDDLIPASLIDSYKTSRLAELSRKQQIVNSRSGGGGLKPIGREDYLQQVNQASQVDLDPHSTSPLTSNGTGVVVCLWNNSSSSKLILSLLEKLSHHYPATRFLTIRGDSCIANYPDAHQPTLICYRAGNCLRQYVGIGSSLEISNSNGRLSTRKKDDLLKIKVEDLEFELKSIGVLDPHLKTKSSQGPSSSSTPIHDNNNHPDDNDDDDDDNRSWDGPHKAGGSLSLKTKTSRSIRKSSNNDSDSELDL